MKRKNRIRDRAPGQVVLGYAVLAAMIVVALVPLVWTFLSSLKADPLMEPGMTLPKKVCLDGYVTVLTKLEIGRYFLNSLFCATISVLISLTHISMSSYVIARMRFRGRGLITALLMSTLFIPGIALTFPVYNLVNKLGLYNTRWGLIFIYSCSSIAMSFFVIRNYFATIPRELEEAARSTGASRGQITRHVTVPLSRYGLIGSWLLMFLIFEREYSTGVYLLSPGTETIGSMLVSLWAAGAIDIVAALSFINILLAGVLLGSSYIYTRNLCFPIALHWFWNWIQGPVLGYEVSGNKFGESMLTLHLPEANLMNGGAFGFEGSMLCTVLMILGTGVILKMFRIKDRKVCQN